MLVHVSHSVTFTYIPYAIYLVDELYLHMLVSQADLDRIPPFYEIVSRFDVFPRL